MVDFSTLTPENINMFAMKHYDNPNCKGLDEFKDDLKRFSYVKRLLKKLHAGDLLKQRLIVNHLIIESYRNDYYK